MNKLYPTGGAHSPHTGHLYKPSHCLPGLRSLPLGQPGLSPMRAYIVEITAKVLVRSETDPEELPADIYSQIAEFVHNEEDLLELGIELFTLPVDLCGSAPD